MRVRPAALALALSAGLCTPPGAAGAYGTGVAAYGAPSAAEAGIVPPSTGGVTDVYSIDAYAVSDGESTFDVPGTTVFTRGKAGLRGVDRVTGGVTRYPTHATIARLRDAALVENVAGRPLNPVLAAQLQLGTARLIRRGGE